MWWLFGQVWVLCLVSFLVGAVVTWAVFGARQRPTRPSGVDGGVADSAAAAPVPRARTA